MLCFSTKLEDMNECDAPESNNMVAKTELTRNSEHYVLCFLSLLCVDVVDAGSSMGLPHLLIVVVAKVVVAVNWHAVGSRY
jgi:hypothetical protein